MKRSVYRTLGLMTLVALTVSVASAAPGPRAGRIAGVVVDPQGTPQMGATVFVVSEQSPNLAPVQLLTNARGIFSTEGLDTGFLFDSRFTGGIFAGAGGACARAG